MAQTPQDPQQASRQIDPVCGILVSVAEAIQDELTRDYNGQVYYFCCEECKEEFDMDPDMYAS